MKLVIQGDVDLPVIGEAVTKALDAVSYDPERFLIRGATLYFNFYDRKTGDLVAFEKDGEAIENLVFQTPVEKERKRQLAIARKSKTKRIGV
jgi:hypothetical protein